MGFEARSWPANGGTAGDVLASYGVRTTNGKFGAEQNTDDIIKRVLWDFSYNDLPDGASDALGLDHIIPANSTIVSATLFIDTAFTSTSTTTDLTVGLNRATDGTTAIDADGLITAANATQTTIGTAGNVVTGTGALVGALSDATYDGVLVVAPNVDDLTAGAGRIIVEYILNS
jgi:hypothetical protein